VRSERTGGFTLLEIIIALGILSLVAAALMPALNGSLRLSSRAAGEREAVLLAESKLAELGAGRLEPGSRSGREAGALAWRSDISLAASTPALARYSVSVTVQPAQGAPVRLSTTLLGPAP
jgi:general secretion pathway protein I